MTAPAVSGAAATQWHLTPAKSADLFSTELGAMSLATWAAWWWISQLTGARSPRWRRRCLCRQSGFGDDQ